MTDHTPTTTQLSLDKVRRRKPLRLGISRRQVPGLATHPQFVTRVRVGKKAATLVPWPGGDASPGAGYEERAAA